MSIAIGSVVYALIVLVGVLLWRSDARTLGLYREQASDLALTADRARADLRELVVRNDELRSAYAAQQDRHDAFVRRLLDDATSERNDWLVERLDLLRRIQAPETGSYVLHSGTPDGSEPKLHVSEQDEIDAAITRVESLGEFDPGDVVRPPAGYEQGAEPA